MLPDYFNNILMLCSMPLMLVFGFDLNNGPVVYIPSEVLDPKRSKNRAQVENYQSFL